MGCGTGRDFLSQIRKAIRSEIKNESNNYMKVTTGTVIGVNSGKATIRPPFGPSNGSQDYIAQIVTSQNVTIGSVVNIAYWCNLSTAIVVSQVGNTGLNIINKNLVDNPNFSINQRGFSSSNWTSGFGPDRWQSMGNGNIEYTNNNYVVTNGQYLLQFYLPKYIKAGTYTISAICTNDIVGHFGNWTGNDIQYSSTNYSNGIASATFKITEEIGSSELKQYLYILCKNSGKIYYIKMENGENQTLAYIDYNGNTILYEEVDYINELLKCQRYFRRFPSNWSLGNMQGTSAVFEYGINPQMVSVPTISVQNPSDLTNCVDDGRSSYTADSFIVRTARQDLAEFYYTGLPSDVYNCIFNLRYIDVSTGY